LMNRSTEQGMQTFDRALYDLYSQGEITYADALSHADSANDLRLMIKMGADADPDQMMSANSGLTLDDDDYHRR